MADVVAARRRNVMPAAMLRVAPDHRLVDEVHAGSERAFEVLFNRHHRPVLAFCRHMLGSREEAEDAAQQTFLTAYREIARGEQPRSVRPWLYTIARHRCLSALRGRRRRSLEDVPDVSADNVLTEVTTREELHAILADVARLPHDQRAALVLAELGDTSHAEIARIVGCPQAKVKALVFQARSSLTAERTAREISCAEVQELLATLRGGALRRGVLWRHLHDCPGCRAFRDDIRVQRRRLGLLLPGAPFLALKRAVLGTVFGSGGGGAGGAALTAGALSGGGLAVTTLVALAIPGGPLAADGAVSRDGREPARPAALARTPGHETAAPASASTPHVAGRQATPEQIGQGTRAEDVTQLRKRPGANAEATRPVAPEQPNGRHQPDRASSDVEARPAAPPNPAEPSEPPADDLPAEPARPAKPPKPPQATRRVTPATPVKPSHPPTPGKSPKVNGPIAPGNRPEPPAATPPAKPDGPNQPPPVTAPGSGPTPSKSADPSPGGAHAPGVPGNGGQGGNGHGPAGG